eukprot:179582-Amphidinium_carterae.1
MSSRSAMTNPAVETDALSMAERPAMWITKGRVNTLAQPGEHKLIEHNRDGYSPAMQHNHTTTRDLVSQRETNQAALPEIHLDYMCRHDMCEMCT